MIKEVNDMDFEKEVIDSEVPVVVDFWAPWCGPCKMLTPVIEDVEKELGSKVKFVKVNVDENVLSAQKYNIYSIPSVMVFKKGDMINNMVGFRPKNELINEINNCL